MSKKITVTWLRDHVAVGQQEEDGPTLLLDRPIARGGQGLGFNGGHLMLLGLGACLKSVLLGAAEAREVPVHGLRIEVLADDAAAPTRYDNIRVHVEVSSPADGATWEKLLAIAKRGCQVSNTLAAGASVDVTLNATGVLEGQEPAMTSGG